MAGSEEAPSFKRPPCSCSEPPADVEEKCNHAPLLGPLEQPAEDTRKSVTMTAEFEVELLESNTPGVLDQIGDLKEVIMSAPEGLAQPSCERLLDSSKWQSNLSLKGLSLAVDRRSFYLDLADEAAAEALDVAEASEMFEDYSYDEERDEEIQEMRRNFNRLVRREALEVRTQLVPWLEHL